MMKFTFVICLTAIISAGAAADLCPATAIHCLQNQETYEPGDPVILSARMCNGDPENELPGDLYMVLEVYGTFFFYPSWSKSLDSLPLVVPVCGCSEVYFLDFTAPDIWDGISAYAAFIDNWELMYFCMYDL